MRMSFGCRCLGCGFLLVICSVSDSRTCHHKCPYEENVHGTRRPTLKQTTSSLLLGSLFQDLGITILNQFFSSWFTGLWWFVENHRLDFNKMYMMLSTSNVVVLAGGVFADSLRCGPHWMVWPSVRLRYKKALLMWVSRMRCAAWKRSSTSHPRIFRVKTYSNKTNKLQYSTLKVDSYVVSQIFDATGKMIPFWHIILSCVVQPPSVGFWPIFQRCSFGL